MFMFVCSHSRINVASRSFATLVNPDKIASFDFTKQKIISLRPFDVLPSQFADKLKNIPIEAQWDKPSPIVICTRNPSGTSPKKHAYFGGLPALAQAVRSVLEKNTKEPVVYINDGCISKATQSGHQAHVHPSEWTTPDCGIPHLIKTMLIGMGILKQPLATDLKHYSYLHFPFSRQQFLHAPGDHLSLYGRFFKHRVLHHLMSSHHSSSDDHWLCEGVRNSLNFYEKLNQLIVEKAGTPIFQRGFRIYWSSDSAGLLRKKTTWESLGIPCEWMSQNEMNKTTLLDSKKSLYALKVLGDGRFFPNISEKSIEYLKQEYPNQFEFKEHCAVSKIFVDFDSTQPWGLETIDAFGKKELTHLHSFFGSPGHNKVFHEGSSKPLWEEVPVSGVSSLWVCTLNQEDTLHKLENLQNIVASANLTNLHVTPWDVCVEQGQAKLLVRVTQGANFNSTIADKNDLLNMAFNLKQFYVGDWELISAGTCTRKTTVANVPAYMSEWPDDSGFLHGLSGIGFSFSGVSKEFLKRPATEVTLKNALKKIFS